MQQNQKLKLITLLLCSAALVGCAGDRVEKAEQLAAGAAFAQGQVAAGRFLLTVYSRVQRPGEAATVYIEGDGRAFSGYRPTSDPTPTDPVALKLAGADAGPNVIYLARPCQYSGLVSGEACPSAYWTSKRFAPEVIAAVSSALDTLKQRHGLSGFHLVGFSGGAAVAVLAAAQRDDVLSLRTVAGNIDNAALTSLHKVSAMPESLNPADVALLIATLPQRHFIGGKDKIVTPAIFASYARRAGASGCVGHRVVAEASHTDGWVERWVELLREAVECGRRTEDGGRRTEDRKA